MVLLRFARRDARARSDGARPAACALGGTAVPRSARCSGRLARAAARLPRLLLLPHGRASRVMAAIGRQGAERRGLRSWRDRARAKRELVACPRAEPLLRIRL